MASALSQAASHLVSSDTPDKNNPTTHKRTYQACIPCRRRKVRCDLGPVDDPHEPPCVRCRRESKECYFSATRRKRKTEDGDGLAEGSDNVDDDYAERNSRRRTSLNQPSPLSRDATLQHSQRSLFSGSQPSTPTVATYSLNNRELPPPSNSYYGDIGDGSTETSQDQEVTNDTAAALFQSPINNPGDALHLLLEASGRTDDVYRHQNRPQSHQHDSSLTKEFAVPRSIYNGQRPYDGLAPALSSQPTNIDPAIITGNMTEPHSITSEFHAATKAWSRLRFVRAGWLTTTEAMSYLDYFYRHLAPLTPISPPDFRSPATHPKLLNEEPMLTVTILTIAARYKKLTGLGGHSRSYMIHDKLWIYLQNMITRMFWGQEQFGGGFCGAGSRKVDQKAADRGGLRSMGTIESLLLLSEFHPRSMHFPPGDDDSEILAPLEETLATNGDDAREIPSSGENTISGWTEPALRSDRMCWSLISTAYALAYELGVFGNFSDGMRTPTDIIQHKGGALSEGQRAERVKRLLFIYVTQTSGRLGFPSMFPEHVHDRHFADAELDSFQGQSRAPQSSIETIQRCWAGITTIMKITNTKLFPSKERTRELIKSGEYLSLLEQHQPILTLWKSDFDNLHVEKLPKVILSMEFEYARVYSNSLALQAVLEHWTSRVGASHPSERSGTSSLAALYRQNEYYISECVDASRTLLRHLVNGLLPEDSLKHAPTRTYFRILSGAMFLLKTFALGAKEEEVAISLQLLDATVRALRTSVVDDVHLCLRIADLLEGLTSSIRNKFVRLAAPTARRRATSPRKRRGKYPQMAVQQDATDRSARYLFSNSNNARANDPLAGISTSPVNPQDNNISIMPPSNEIYNIRTYTSNSNPQNFTQQSFEPQQPHLYPNGDNLSPQVSEEDWLTLNLNPLLSDTTVFGNGESENWFGDFGPEIINNLEVLGKLVEGYEPGGVGFG